MIEAPLTVIDMWLLPPPEGFVGLDRHKDVTVYRRHLPHWRQEGATYAVTFRQHDSLPRYRIEELKELRRNWETRHPDPWDDADWEEYVRLYTRRVDAWLDEGSGSCLLAERSNAQVLAEALTKFHGQRYHTGAYAIMPNHCHVVIRPFDGQSLELILSRIKGAVAREINQRAGTTGTSLWTEESYDRIVRDGEHLARTIAYIGANPGKAGLADEESWRIWIAPEWVKAGWHFDVFDRG